MYQDIYSPKSIFGPKFKLYEKLVIVAKKVDEQLQSKQALGLRGGYCFETAAPHRVIQVVGK
ncbi:MAG: hypothetical protein LBO80_07930, partial [Treponema sp.]|nr:hypothetical protein [Treponema sp.]